MPVMQLSCYLLILQFILLYHFFISDKQIESIRSRFKRAKFQKKLLQLTKVLRKGTKADKNGTERFRSQTRSVPTSFISIYVISILIAQIQRAEIMQNNQHIITAWMDFLDIFLIIILTTKVSYSSIYFIFTIISYFNFKIIHFQIPTLV